MVILLHNEADFSHEMSLNACKAQHIIHDFFFLNKPDSSPISSHIKHIILSPLPDRIPWKTRLVQQLTCISKYFKKSCIVFSNIYRSMAWSKSTSLPPFLCFSQQEWTTMFFSLPPPIWLNLHFWRDPASRVWAHVVLRFQKKQSTRSV